MYKLVYLTNDNERKEHLFTNLEFALFAYFLVADIAIDFYMYENNVLKTHTYWQTVAENHNSAE